MNDKNTVLIIFNHDDPLEFGECALCGREHDPEYRKLNPNSEPVKTYPPYCRKCGATITDVIMAEDVR